jgi:hypothetical protein
VRNAAKAFGHRGSGTCIKGVLGANGAPKARAETRGPGTGPRPAAPKPSEPPGPMGDARASHCIHPDLSRGGNPAGQLNRMKNERSMSLAIRTMSATAMPMIFLLIDSRIIKQSSSGRVSAARMGYLS